MFLPVMLLAGYIIGETRPHESIAAASIPRRGDQALCRMSSPIF